MAALGSTEFTYSMQSLYLVSGLVARCYLGMLVISQIPCVHIKSSAMIDPRACTETTKGRVPLPLTASCPFLMDSKFYTTLDDFFQLDRMIITEQGQGKF